jgi:hypothetical protein
MALTKVTYSMIEDAAINVRNYGASSSATAAANLAAFKLAVAATPVGGTLYVPPDAAEYVIDTTGGQSTAIDINKRMTVWIDGVVKSNFGAIQANPPTIFLVSGDDVWFTGNGIVQGDGAINDANAGTAATSPSLIKVTGDSFTMDTLTVRKPHKYGVNLFQCKYAKITNCNFTGGPTEYRDTAHFAINVFFGERHIVDANQFYPDDDGGMCVQCVFVNSANNMSIQGNIAIHPYEKLAYVVSSNNIISNNIVEGNPNFIPGTNQKGTIGPPIRNDGINSKITNNFIRLCGGGISAIGGGSLDISGNTMMLVGQSGVAVFDGTVDFRYLSIRNNVIVVGNIPGIGIGNGILVRHAVGSSYFLDISHNQVIGFGVIDSTVNIAAWTPNTVIPRFALIKPTVFAGRIFSTGGGGTTGATEPVWNTTPGATTTDGTVTWTALPIDNTVFAGILLDSSGPAYEKAIISYNNVSGELTGQATRNGIWTKHLQNSVVSNNTLTTSVVGIREDNGLQNEYITNSNDLSPGGAAQIQGLAATSNGQGNTYNKKPNTKNITLPAGVATLTIATSVMVAAPNALIVLSPTNSQAAAFMAANGIYAGISSPNVVVVSGNGTNFAGTEQFNVQIIQ